MLNIIKLLICSLFLGIIIALPCSAGEMNDDDEKNAGGVKGLDERIQKLEEVVSRKVSSDKWYDKLQISGAVEVEAGYENIDYQGSAMDDERASNVDLATVEMAVDVKIYEHIDGHVMFKYGDDDLFLDEGFITLAGTFPGYLIAGRQYIPFGNFESFFITDPTTLILGETNVGSAVAGYHFTGDLAELAFGVFNGAAQEADDDDAIDSIVATLLLQPLESLTLGASYTSNLASSDSLNEYVQDPDNLDSIVGGWSAFVTWSVIERLTVIGEYVGSIKEFKAGEIYDATDIKERKPAAWNVELGFAINEALEIAGRYGGSEDGGDSASGEFLLPESQYGLALNWGLFDSTNLAFEYVHNEYEDDYKESDTALVQLAIEF